MNNMACECDGFARQTSNLSDEVRFLGGPLSENGAVRRRLSGLSWTSLQFTLPLGGSRGTSGEGDAVDDASHIEHLLASLPVAAATDFPVSE